MGRVEPITARRPTRWVAKVLVFVVSVAVSVEGGAMLVLSISPLRERATGVGDVSYRLEWVRMHRRTGWPGPLAWPAPIAVYHPTRGWALKAGIRGTKVGGAPLNTNSKGLRGKVEFEYPRTPGRQRILVFGDSYTFGSEVADDETYTQDLQSRLPNTEALNFSVHGYGHDQMLLYLKEEGVKYHPDIVILGFTWIDVYRNIEGFFIYAKPRFKLLRGSLELTNVPVPSPEEIVSEEHYRLKAFDIALMLRDKLRWSLGENEAEARQITGRLLAEFVRTTRAIGATPVFVYLPVFDEIQPLPEHRFGVVAASPPVGDREQCLRRFCEAASVPCLFLGPRFREEARRGVDLNPLRHWNRKAHSLAAEEISAFLLHQNLSQSR